MHLHLNHMATTEREVKERQAALKESGHTKADVQRLADVSERAVYKWYRGEMTSKKIAAVHASLVNGKSTQQKQIGRRSAETLAAS